MTFATAHAAEGEPDLRVGVQQGTVVFYMGLGRLEVTCASIIAGGRSGDTPAAVVSHATRSDQRTVIGTLADIARKATDAALEAPALLVIGEVVARRVVSPAVATTAWEQSAAES